MLQVEALTKRYGKTISVNGVSLYQKVPGILCILGPSGSGKTTLLRLMAGLEVPDQGRVLIDDKTVSTPERVTPPSARGLSLIFQDFALWPHMTVRENIEFVISGNGMPKKQKQKKVDRVLEWMHLETYGLRYPQQLSGGEKQRLAIARALISEPRYLLMDEPFAHLDPLLIEDLKGIILRLKEEVGMAVIYVTHAIEIALSLSDKIAIINKGVIEQVGATEEIIRKPQSDLVRQFLRLGMVRREHHG